MDSRGEASAFLTTRRARITPEVAGLTNYGRNRRVPGLRRSEVADLAGVSVEYYAQLERGNLRGVSGEVLDALARALRLDDAEREHLARLAEAAGPARRRPHRVADPQLRPSILRILDAMPSVPAFVGNGRLDVLAANPLARALYAPAFDGPAFDGPERPVNLARFNFLDPRARTFWSRWETAADDTVAMLRTEAGRNPYDRALSDLVGELSTRSEQFRTRWAAHDVRVHRTGRKHIHHPTVGHLELDYEVLELPADTGLTLVVFSAAAGTPHADALRLIASWAAVTETSDAP